jgi:hypothetical protein
MDGTDDWKAGLQKFLAERQQGDEIEAAVRQRLTVLVTAYLHDVVIPACQEFRDVVAPSGRAVVITPDDGGFYHDWTVTGGVKISVNHGDRLELASEISVSGYADPDSPDLDLLMVSSEDTHIINGVVTLVEDTAIDNGVVIVEKGQPATENYFYDYRPSTDTPPTHDEIASHLAMLFMRGASGIQR